WVAEEASAKDLTRVVEIPLHSVSRGLRWRTLARGHHSLRKYTEFTNIHLESAVCNFNQEFTEGFLEGARKEWDELAFYLDER
ncbi:MAG: hypothetical protein JW940_30530, partial [Polyangiaceae bacterium]|nr:hypothetical protein [Polyangiaceae bacterium]